MMSRTVNLVATDDGQINDDSAGWQADLALRQALTRFGTTDGRDLSWEQCEHLAELVRDTLRPRRSQHSFMYHHDAHLHGSPAPISKPYDVPLAWFSNDGGEVPLIAVGGLTNVSHRFDFLASDLAPQIRLVGLDLAGRGLSGWMADIEDYRIDVYTEQLRQFMIGNGFAGAALLGSSLGGTAAIRLAAHHPDLVSCLILNDTGPYIPASRRARRARVVARHYVFHTPADLFRRIGAAAKFTGRTPDAALLHSAMHKTRWSDEERGRVYRHDLRALLAYRKDAATSLDVWSDWDRITCPVLLLHGQLSDATSAETVTRMLSCPHLKVLRIRHTGHTPFLCDAPLAHKIALWMADVEALPRDSIHEPPDWPRRVLYPEM